MWDYSETVREHFLHPRNAGSLPDANAIGEVGSLACGDALKLYLKINPQGIIEDARFQTFGCASAIASSSALTELIKGKTVDTAEKITNKDIVRYLGGLPKEKMHCSVLGEEALEAAIRDWRHLEPREQASEGLLVCKCFGVTDAQILKAARENDLSTVEEVTNFTKAGGACGECRDRIQELLERSRGTAPRALTEIRPARKAMSNIQRMQKIIRVIDEDIRPRLAQDGGDLELVDVEGSRVIVSMRGTCASCRASQLTIKELVEKNLREQVDPAISVVEA
jgi:NifU-like protein